MTQPDSVELSVLTCKTRWRPIVFFPPVALAIGWLASSNRFGQALAAAGVVVLMDFLLVLWRTRSETLRLRVPTTGRVGSEAKFQLQVEHPHAIGRLSTPTKVMVSRDRTTAIPWASHVYSGWSASNETEHLDTIPMHRGRGWVWLVVCVDHGLMGTPYRRRSYQMISQQPFSVGPQRVPTSNWQPVELPSAKERVEGIDMRVSAGQPVLRQWQPGDRTASIDWRRTERIDEMVVGVSEAHRPRVAVLANLGRHPGAAVEVAAANWATVAENWMRKADVVLVWNERGTTCVRPLVSPGEIDVALAGAEPGPFDRRVLAEAGVPKHVLAKL